MTPGNPRTLRILRIRCKFKQVLHCHMEHFRNIHSELQRWIVPALKIMVGAVILIAFACGVECFDSRMAGYALVGMLFALTVVYQQQRIDHPFCDDFFQGNFCLHGPFLRVKYL